MITARRALAVVAVSAATFALAWGSRAPMRLHGSDAAVLRVAWSARPERIEQCRTPTEAEVAQLPAHMRQRQVCTGVAATYRLEVHDEGALLVDEEVRGGGLRNDRRLFVFRDVLVPAGTRRVDVRFTRREAGDGRGVSESRADVVPPRLVFEEPVTFRPRAVALVTYDAEQRQLVLVRAAPGS